ncbi:MAG: ABC transporter permease [Eubacterium sp.]|nr:ABC transporter permease [Eubacterium sp.]
MSFRSLLGTEIQKLRRSKILLLLLIPVIMMWIPGIVRADLNFGLRDIPITPEKNFFIQGFMGMAWFMIPASCLICTILLIQTERSQRGIVKMLSLPVNTAKLCLAKFTVLLGLLAIQLAMSIGTYYISALIASRAHHYSFTLEPLYVLRGTVQVYAGAVPTAAVFWMLAVLIQAPVFSAGIGLASIVPSVLVINTKFWFAYPASYPFYLLMVEYGKAAKGIYETRIAWLPWLPVAIVITTAALAVSCLRFGASERRSL